MNIKGLAFEDGKITSYLFSLSRKKILFDFGSEDITDDELKLVDYVFISHYHYDHICGLLNRMHVLNKHCKIYMTRTTKEILYLLINRGNERSTSVYNKMMQIYNNNIHIALFNKVYKEDGLEFKFYRSGHCFGGAMLYIKDNKHSLFFSSDMNYDSNEIDNQYYVQDIIDADFAILDGTIINDEDYKASRLNSIKFNNKSDLYIQCKLEKAVIIAKSLAKKYPQANIVFEKDLEPFIYTFAKNGYSIFKCDFKIYVQTLVDNKPTILSNNYCIYLSSVSKKGNTPWANNLFSLHIGNKDRKEFIEKTFTNKTQILLGHYTEKSYIDEYCNFNNYIKIEKGEHNYGRKK